jgi:hypothetical protein
MKYLALLILGIASITGCGKPVPVPAFNSGEAVIPKGQRKLGMGVTEGAVGFETAFAKARTAGLDFIELPQQWDECHSAPNEFQTPFLPIANQVYPLSKTSVVLCLNPIDTSTLRVPQWLAKKPFDDPEVIHEFCNFLDHAFKQLKDVDIIAISIGNEVDSWLSTHADSWLAYGRFVEAVIAHLHTVKPGLSVGVKTTWPAAVVEHSQQIARLNEKTDVFMLTYYPLTANFRVRSVEDIGTDIERACNLAGKKPIYLLETGYPSGQANNSSEAQQADFVTALFTAWDKHATQIPLVNFVWLHDISTQEITSLTTYYGSKDNAFASFLGTLGLCSHTGQPKPAFERSQKEAQARGW